MTGIDVKRAQHKTSIFGIISNRTTLHHKPNGIQVTTIGHNTAFNNEQNPFNIESYKRSRNEN